MSARSKLLINRASFTIKRQKMQTLKNTKPNHSSIRRVLKTSNWSANIIILTDSNKNCMFAQLHYYIQLESTDMGYINIKIFKLNT